MEKYINILIFIGNSFFSGIGLILLKMAISSSKFVFNIKSMIDLISVKFIVGFCFYVFGFILWMIILSKFKLNFAFPIAMSLIFIVSSLGSLIILKENFGINHIIGTLFCLIGIIIITIK